MTANGPAERSAHENLRPYCTPPLHAVVGFQGMSKGGKDIRLFGQCAGRMLPAGKTFLLIAILLLVAMVSAATAEPKRVLFLHSFGRDFSPWAQFASSFRTELDRQSKSTEAVEYFDASLMTERFGADQDEGPFVEYLQALFAKRRLDLILAIGAPAARFVQQHRSRLSPSTPMLFGAVEQRRVSLSALGQNDTVVATSADYAALVRNILRVLPETTSIAVVLGNSPIEKYWVGQLRDAFLPFADRIAFEWFSDLSLEEMLKRAATLPPKSAILYISVNVDAAGRSYEGDKAFASLRAVTNAPIFPSIDVFFGKGMVGGPIVSVHDTAQRTAEVAIRILNGEAPGNIKTPPVAAGTPKFDWRELKRWNISEANLPPGSEVHFRELNPWDQYRWQMYEVTTARPTQQWETRRERRRRMRQALPTPRT